LASRNIIKHKLSSLFLLKEREEKEEKLGSALITKKKKKSPKIFTVGSKGKQYCGL
jgi:hypothetical protein